MALIFYATETMEQARQVILTVGRHQYDGTYVWGLDSKLRWIGDIGDVPRVAAIVKELMGFGEPVASGIDRGDKTKFKCG